MCGIIAVLRRPSDRTPASSDEVLGLLEGAAASLPVEALDGVAATMDDLAARIEAVDRLLRGTPGVRTLLADRSLGESLDAILDAVTMALGHIEERLDSSALTGSLLEQ